MQQLHEALLVLGADPDDARLPDDLVVVQVGDLVHRGPDSAGVVALVDALLNRQPDRWVQLTGNHEACHLRQPLFPHDDLDEAIVQTLQRWERDRLLHLAAAIDTPSGQTLVTQPA